LHTLLPAAIQKPARQQVPAPALLFFAKAAEQMLHEAAPRGLNVPAGQALQEDIVVAPAAVLNVPAAQGSQEGVPLAA
jgi:hypothetical protein